MYQENKINPVKLDPDSQTKPQIYDVEIAKNGYQTELKLPAELKHPIEIQYAKSGAPVELRPKQDVYQTPYIDRPKKAKKKDPKMANEPRQLQPHEIDYATIIPVNYNNNNLVFMDNNSNFERASLILEDYAENRPDIDLKEPGIDNPRYLTDLKPRLYQVYESTNRSKEQIIKVNEMSSRASKEHSAYQTSTPNYNQQQPFDFNYSTSRVEVEKEEQTQQQKSSEYSVRNIIPNFLNLFSRKSPGSSKDPMTKF